MRTLTTELLFCFIGILRSVFAQDECETGWYYYEVTGSCYSVNYERKTQPMAEKSCNDSGAHLVSIHSQNENQFISSKLRVSKDKYWIGAEYLWYVDGINWIWTDGTLFNYSDFAHNHPGFGSCAVMWSYQDWSWVPNECEEDYDILELNPFVCKKEAYGMLDTEIATSGVYSSSRHWWWCLFGSVCGPNCCSNNDCCSGPDVCASGVTCSKLQCQHRGGNNCGEDCCEGSTPICCDKGDGTNVCVESSDACNSQLCTQDNGKLCGTQCCTRGSFCCDGKVKQCVQSISQCNALKCIDEKEQVCGNSCCKDGQMCCNGTCFQQAKDCLQQECFEKGGEVCGRSCCTGGLQCCAGLGVCGTPLSCQEQQCNINPGDHWCNEQNECCATESWVCCQSGAPATCAANIQLCNLDFAEGYSQKKINN